MPVRQDPLYLAFGYINTVFAQLFQQQRLCGLTMMVLVQDEANEFWPKMVPIELYGKLGVQGVTLWRDPAFEAIARVARSDDQILNDKIPIAFGS